MEEAEVADSRTFTESEHLLILNDRVQEETASLNAKVTLLESEKASLLTEKADLQTKLDVADAEKANLAAKVTTVETEFAQFKTDLTEMAAAVERKETRVAAVKEKAAHLADDWFTAERAERWSLMPEEAFEAYVADLAAAGAGAPAAPKVPETAAFSGGQSPADKSGPGTPTATRNFLAAMAGDAK